MAHIFFLKIQVIFEISFYLSVFPHRWEQNLGTVGSVIQERNSALLKLNSEFRDFGLELGEGLLAFGGDSKFENVHLLLHVLQNLAKKIVELIDFLLTEKNIFRMIICQHLVPQPFNFCFLPYFISVLGH